MNRDEDKLSALLKQWREVEPSATFEASVRRRIRLEEKKPEPVNWVEWLRQLEWRPALALATVVVASVLIRSSAGILTLHREVALADTDANRHRSFLVIIFGRLGRLYKCCAILAGLPLRDLPCLIDAKGSSLPPLNLWPPKKQLPPDVVQ
jgi:hypothetical protein